jgi:hypothetical protein
MKCDVCHKEGDISKMHLSAWIGGKLLSAHDGKCEKKLRELYDKQ